MPHAACETVEIIARSAGLVTLTMKASLLSMTDSEGLPNNIYLIRQVLLAAWLVAVWAVAIGIFLLVFHEQGGDEIAMPRRYESPVVGTEERHDDLSVRYGTGWVLPQSGSTTTPNIPPTSASDP
jgi:hypothetical protein